MNSGGFGNELSISKAEFTTGPPEVSGQYWKPEEASDILTPVDQVEALSAELDRGPPGRDVIKHALMTIKQLPVTVKANAQERCALVGETITCVLIA